MNWPTSLWGGEGHWWAELGARRGSESEGGSGICPHPLGERRGVRVTKYMICGDRGGDGGGGRLGREVLRTNENQL